MVWIYPGTEKIKLSGLFGTVTSRKHFRKGIMEVFHFSRNNFYVFRTGLVEFASTLAPLKSPNQAAV